MNKSTLYPRVLIIYHSRINKADQYHISIRGWFADWPKENLAQIYSGGEFGEEVFCGYNFKIGEKERRFGNYFFKLKGSSLGQSSYSFGANKGFKKLQKLSFWSLFKHKVGSFLINTGLWELIFKPVISKEMMDFVKKFDPKIIYCQGYNLTFSWLPVMIEKSFHIPVCFQTGDDWPSHLYKKSPLSYLIRPTVYKAVKSLLNISIIRLANGKLMAEDFGKRYNMPFEPLMMCDSLTRFDTAPCRRVVDSDTISIVYTGNLIHGRWASIVDLCMATKLLQRDGFKIMITAYANAIPPEAINKVLKMDNLQIHPAPSHEELPAYLKGADILYLPETMDDNMADEIALSISTKAHLYMMSQKPILVYASPNTGIMKYAKEEEWACIVEEQNLATLSAAVHKLLTDDDYKKKLVNRGLQVVVKNHEEHKVKERFLSVLNENRALKP